jgi:hypothetical protein
MRVVCVASGAGAEEVSKAMWDNDYRFLAIAREHVEALTLDDVRSAVMYQMTTDSAEVYAAPSHSYCSILYAEPSHRLSIITSI